MCSHVNIVMMHACTCSSDDDMQSTFSAMSAGMDSVTYDDDDEDEVDGGDPNEVGEVEFHRTGEAHSPKGSPLE